ncbi:MAG: hypothetical protein QF724_04295 [Planctomycetota bacterium]|nr:hypothetical protein [Planctomycetota bacterium]
MRRITTIVLTLSCMAPFVHGQCDPQEVLDPGNGGQWGFGRAVSMDGELAAIGSPEEWYEDGGDGEVSLYRDVAGLWQHEATIQCPQSFAGGTFGASVDLLGETLLVGGSHGRQVAVFEQQAGAWLHTATIDRDQFPGQQLIGDSLAMAATQSETVAVVGAPMSDTRNGSAVIMRRNSAGWQAGEVLTPWDEQTLGRFGSAVAIAPDGVRLAVGAPHENWISSTSGAVYVFGLFGSSYGQLQVITPEGPGDNADYRKFGQAVDMDEEVLVIGSRGVTSPVALGGSVHIYSVNDVGIPKQATLFSPAGVHDDGFGASVALDGDRLLVGAPLSSGGGAVYRYQRTVRGWEYTDMLQASAPEGKFGKALAACDGRALIGGPELSGDSSSHAAGFVSFFGRVTESYCQATPNSTGQAAVLTSVGATSIAADDLALYAADCPPGQSGVFFAGTDRVMLPYSAGYLCIGGRMARLAAPQAISQGGYASLALDLDASLPQTPSGLYLPGATIHFQFMYQDSASGAGAQNFTQALSITFCP